MKKNILRAVCVLISAGLVSCGKKAEPSKKRDDTIPITVAKVESLPVNRTLPIVGTLFAKDESTISAQVEGQVEKTRVDFGDRVTNNQELASIDTASYEALAQQSAATVARAKASADNASRNLKRIRQLATNQISSAFDLDKAISDAKQADAEVKAAEAADAIAKLNVERSQVRAPFDAAVAERIASAGDYMKIGSPLFRLVNDGVLKYIVQAPETYSGQVQKGQLVKFTVDAWPGETFEGKVFLISPAVNTSTRAFAFGSLVQNPGRRLKASSFARGELILEKDAPTLTVPLDAIVNFAGVTKVFVVENSIVHPREVKAGGINDGRQEILSGLKAGETVALTGQTKLFEGTKVRIQTDSPAR